MSNYGSRAINRWWTSAYAQWGWGAAAGTKESLARKDAWLATINKYLVHSGRGGNALLSVRCQDIWLATTSLPLFRNTRNSCIRIANTNDTYILGYIGIWEWENRGGGGSSQCPHWSKFDFCWNNKHDWSKTSGWSVTSWHHPRSWSS